MDPKNTVPSVVEAPQNSNPIETNSSRKPFLHRMNIIIFCILLFGLLVGGIGFILGSRSQTKTSVEMNPSPTAPITNPIAPSTQLQMKTYISTRYGFSFQYPSDLELKSSNTTGKKNSSEASLISTDTQYDPHGGWAISGVQLTVFVQDAAGMPMRATPVPALLPAKLNNRKVRTLEGYTQTGGDGIPYIVSISSNSLPPDYITTPAEVDFICFSPSSERCKTILPLMISTFTFP